MRSLLLALALVVAVPFLAVADELPDYERPARTELLSVGANGECPTWYTQRLTISGDGRYAAFSVRSKGLAPGDDIESTKIFVKDLRTGEVEVASVNEAGVSQGHMEFAHDPVLSYTGRYVVFASNDRDLVADKTTGRYDVFLRDRVEDTTERVSLPNGGGEMDRDAYATGVSADGRYILFRSDASNLTEESATARGQQAYLYDRTTKTTTLVSRREDGRTGYQVFQPVLSADGSTILYLLREEDYLGRDPDGHNDFGPPFPPTYVFVYDVASGEVELASPGARGDRPNSWAEWPAVSADGRFVSFMSDATDLVPRDTNMQWDAFVHDRQTGLTERISVADLGGELDLLPEHVHPAISPNGRWAAFLSPDRKVGGNHGATTREVVLHDRWTRTTTLASVRPNGEASRMYNQPPYVSDDGTVVWLAAGHLRDGDCRLLPGYARLRGPDTGVGDLDLALEGSDALVTGDAYFGSVLLAQGESAPSPANAEQPLQAVEVHMRPDRRDLVVRMMPSSMPVISPAVPAPAWWVQRTAGVTAPLLYGFDLSVDGTRHEVRIVGGGRSPDEPLDPRIELHRCPSTCELVGELDGSYGTAGHEIVLSIPLDEIGAGQGSTLEDLRAFAGPAATGMETAGGELHLGDSAIPVLSVSAAPAPSGTQPRSDAYTYPATVTGSSFAARLPAGLASESGAVWVRACVGEICGAKPVAVDEVATEVATELALTIDGMGQHRTLTARLAESVSGAPVEGATIGFFAGDGTKLGDASTDSDGQAVLNVPPRYRAPHEVFEARYTGEPDRYLPSTAAAP